MFWGPDKFLKEVSSAMISIDLLDHAISERIKSSGITFFNKPSEMRPMNLITLKVFGMDEKNFKMGGEWTIAYIVSCVFALESYHRIFGKNGVVLVKKANQYSADLAEWIEAHITNELIIKHYALKTGNGVRKTGNGVSVHNRIDKQGTCL